MSTEGLVRRTLAGDDTAYTTLVSRYETRLALLVRRIGGRALGADFSEEDAVQTALHDAYARLASFTRREHGTPYIAMKLVRGHYLAQRIASTRSGLPVQRTEPLAEPPSTLPPATAPPSPVSGPTTDREIAAVLQIIEKAAEALHAAHEAGIIHRDIKPGNIMVDSAGEPIVMDFGLARDLQDQGNSLTLTGHLFGTPAYFSPEQVSANRIRLDSRTDVYSLGVTLFECLTLRRPLEIPAREGLYQAILCKDAPDIRELNAALPSDLAAVVATALEKDRDRRYQTALAFAEDLRRVRDRKPILARPVTRRTKLVRWAQRNPAVASMTAVVFVVLLAGLGTTLVQKARADANAERAAKNASLAEGNASRAEANAADSRRNLAEFERLADARRLDDLLREQEEDLPPALPSKVAAMESWLGRARELLLKLEGHEAALAELRARAKPWTDAERAKDRASHVSELDLLAGLEEEIAKKEAELKEVAASTMRESRKEEPTDKL